MIGIKFVKRSYPFIKVSALCGAQVLEGLYKKIVNLLKNLSNNIVELKLQKAGYITKHCLYPIISQR